MMYCPRHLWFILIPHLTSTSSALHGLIGLAMTCLEPKPQFLWFGCAPRMRKPLSPFAGLWTWCLRFFRCRVSQCTMYHEVLRYGRYNTLKSCKTTSYQLQMLEAWKLGDSHLKLRVSVTWIIESMDRNRDQHGDCRLKPTFLLVCHVHRLAARTRQSITEGCPVIEFLLVVLTVVFYGFLWCSRLRISKHARRLLRSLLRCPRFWSAHCWKAGEAAQLR